MKIKRYNNNILYRKTFKNNEVKHLMFKGILFYLFNSHSSVIINNRCFYACKSLVFKSRIKNFCIFSGRFRSINRVFRVSRITLRLLGAEGLFFGLKKAS